MKKRDLFSSDKTLYFKPLALEENLPDSEEKKLSVTIRNWELVDRVKSYNEWTVNEFVNTSLEFYIKSFYDREVNSGVLKEAESFRILSKYAAALKAEEAEFLREALNLYIRLVDNEVIKKARKGIMEEGKEASLPELLAAIVKVSAKKNDPDKEQTTETGISEYIHELKNFRPIYQSAPKQTTTKKHSVTLRNADVVTQVCTYRGWQFNTLVNKALEIYTYTFFDQDEEGNVMEIPSLMELENYTVPEKRSKFLREAVEIYSCLLKNGIIHRVKSMDSVKKGSRTMTGILCDLVKKEVDDRAVDASTE